MYGYPVIGSRRDQGSCMCNLHGARVLAAGNCGVEAGIAVGIMMTAPMAITARRIALRAIVKKASAKPLSR